MGGEKVMTFYTYREIEQILLTAIKMPTMSVKTISRETGLKAKSLYNFTCGRTHISPNTADIIIEYLRDCRPDLLIAAISFYENHKND